MPNKEFWPVIMIKDRHSKSTFRSYIDEKMKKIIRSDVDEFINRALLESWLFQWFSAGLLNWVLIDCQLIDCGVFFGIGLDALIMV
jgi:hypothetical protein